MSSGPGTVVTLNPRCSKVGIKSSRGLRLVMYKTTEKEPSGALMECSTSGLKACHVPLVMSLMGPLSPGPFECSQIIRLGPPTSRENMSAIGKSSVSACQGTSPCCTSAIAFQETRPSCPPSMVLMVLTTSTFRAVATLMPVGPDARFPKQRVRDPSRVTGASCATS
eukprot:6484223-Amphidinium_carterae.2